MGPHFLYVIAASLDGPCKLGISRSPEQRLRSLQTGHAEPLSVHHREPVEASLVRVLEKLLHRDLHHHRMSGEWFNLSVEHAVGHVQHTVIRYADVPDLAKRFRRGLV